MITLNYNGRAINTNYDALIENYNGKTLTIETDARLDNYGDAFVFFAPAHDDDGNIYSVFWDYIDPPYDCGNDLSMYADWEHPAKVIEL